MKMETFLSAAFSVAILSFGCGPDDHVKNKVASLRRDYQLVGIITEQGKTARSTTSVAVVKDAQRDRIFILRPGESIPTRKKWQVKTIANSGIVLTNAYWGIDAKLEFKGM